MEGIKAKTFKRGHVLYAAFSAPDKLEHRRSKVVVWCQSWSRYLGTPCAGNQNFDFSMGQGIFGRSGIPSLEPEDPWGQARKKTLSLSSEGSKCSQP